MTAVTGVMKMISTNRYSPVGESRCVNSGRRFQGYARLFSACSELDTMLMTSACSVRGIASWMFSQVVSLSESVRSDRCS